MKRLLLAAVLLLAAPLALAQRSDVLVAGNGTLYSASLEWSLEHPEVESASSTYIVVTVREPEQEPRRVIVPATKGIGANLNPALAYDDESETLFVFWQYMPNTMASELRFASFDARGNWSEPAVFGGANYHIRRNAHIAVTRKAYDEDKDGSLTLVPEINVHAVWWEETGAGERAQYAMLTIKHGEVAVHEYELADLLAGRAPAKKVDPEFNNEIYRHPAIFASSKGDSVDLLFGDVKTQSFRRVTFRPIGNTRVRIPVGIADSGFDGPSKFTVGALSSPIETISPDGNAALLFFEHEGRVKYLLHGDDEGWSPVRSLPEGLSRDMAVSALRRLIGAR